VRYQDQGKWSVQDLWNKPQHLTELNGTVLLIIGYGSIGRELARRAKAFDMRVWGITRSGKGDTTHADKIFPVSALDEALPDADYVVISAPETPETKHLIGAPQIGRMKPTARLINIARGSLLDDAALMHALHTGRMGGAALDVTVPEPLPEDSLLWRAPNLFITPHTSAVSERLWHRETELFLRLLEEWFSGKELSNRVDFSRGY
jgi:phosphoglycerate dehydrogenase-like enzyme